MPKKILSFFLLLAVLFCFASCTLKKPDEEVSSLVSAMTSSEPAESSSEPGKESKTMTVHYMDVGQGDSMFIEFPDGKNMLMDGGEVDMGDRVVSYLRSLGVKKIDYMVATHPHTDHIGGLRKVINAFSVGAFYMPDLEGTTSTYGKLLSTVDQEKIPAHEIKKGVEISTDGTYTIRFLAPSTIFEDDLNNCSAVTMIQYGNTKFLFMGDAGTVEEMTLSGDLDCDVLKVGHHGSYSSSGMEFLARTSPSYAVISCGVGNDYGHPHEESLMRVTATGAHVFRTDRNGNIVITSDGKNITATADRNTEDSDPGFYDVEGNWILNVNSKKIHCPDCEGVADISNKNRKEVHCKLSELFAQGYTACQTCKPGEGKE